MDALLASSWQRSGSSALLLPPLHHGHWQACADHAIQPNATTARTLEKMWAVHEQLYG